MKIRNIWIAFRAISVFLFSYPKLKYVQRTRDDRAAIDFMKKTCKKLIKAANIDLEVEGIENTALDENIILIANHEGFFDILYIMANMDRIIGFVAKDSLDGIPIFSSWMKYYNSIFIDRNDLRAQVKSISQAAEVVKEKGSIAILPEGTRSSKREEFKPGSFKIATRTKAPILACTIINSYGAYEERKTNKRQKAKIIFHKPMYYEQYKDMKKNELAQYFEDLVYDAYVMEDND